MTPAAASVPKPAPAPGGEPAADLVKTLLAPVSGVIGLFGDHMILLGKAIAWLVRPPFRLKLYLEQMEFVGVGSLVIILFVGTFSGAVTSLNGVEMLQRFGQQHWVGAATGIGLSRELAPVFTALMLTARAGSGMATELGSMRITEQIDALTTFAVNPIQYLITPRIVASTLMMPVMTMVFNVVGMIGAYVVAIYMYNVDQGQFIELFRFWVDPKDYAIGLIKAAVFGLALSLIACYQGFNVRGGAKEVGLATTKAVVGGSVSVMGIDYFITKLLFVLWPAAQP